MASDDEEDLWADLDDDESNISVSSNLLELLGRPKDEAVVHKGDADEGRVTWVPPSFSGLTNSSVVTCKTQHWNKDGENGPTVDPAVAPPPSVSPAPTGSSPIAVTPSTAPPQTDVKAVVPAATPAATPAAVAAVPGVAATPAAASTFAFSADGRIVW
mmetsp:Transcript_18419/g.47191  ORF Transcript_18419/g.47191 Transcript_18419/m.47191 type:complete len:158 (-) Transcript_18419:704-1177(-)|eukprot:CAMPEP_0115839938 /NCGR_PEP_ID=MMETSP0287-20121206/6514_1 /TAXON_ID=412157 /ORGANISM="Chrysochromulina rotalis, Strain UIO044" /LENGTH=157 /DNA_ID=CAMNT_0003293535 /DNA_START=72 /DNA_END=545 /DNA_ORIENTATION=-